jgi:hypothetical protein
MRMTNERRVRFKELCEIAEVESVGLPTNLDVQGLVF